MKTKLIQTANLKKYLFRLFCVTLFFITVATCLFISVIAGLSPLDAILACSVLAAAATLMRFAYEVYRYSLQHADADDFNQRPATVASSANNSSDNLPAETNPQFTDPEYWGNLTFGELLADENAYQYVKTSGYDSLVGCNTFFVFCKSFVDYYAARGVDVSTLKIVDLTNHLDSDSLTDDFLCFWANQYRYFISLHAAMTTTQSFGNLANHYLPWTDSRTTDDEWSDIII